MSTADRAAALRDAADVARENRGEPLPHDGLAAFVAWLERRADWEAGRVAPARELSCVLCIFDQCEPPDRDRDRDDPPHDGVAVYITDGTSVCECHLNLMMPDALSRLTRMLGERTRQRNIERSQG